MITSTTPVNTQRYDLFKAIVAFVLLVIIVLLLLRRAPTPAAQTLEAPETATSSAPTVAAPGAVAPEITSAQINADAWLSLQGAAAPGATVELWDGEQRFGVTQADAEGRWAYEAGLTPGPHTLTARWVDSAGALLAASAPVTVDAPPQTIAPTLTLPEGVQANGKLAFTGTGTPGAKVELWADGGLLDATTVGDDGNWAVEATLSSGRHTLVTRWLDVNGNLLSESEPVTLDVPDIAPSAPTPIAETPTPTPAAQQPAAPGNGNCGVGVDRGTTYVVARCEYMALIAQRTGVRLADLIAANPLIIDPNRIYPGQIINLPPR